MTFVECYRFQRVTFSVRYIYNTGARVSEITGLQRSQVQFGTKSFVQFKGKGRKERAVPLWSSTSRTLRSWFGHMISTLARPSEQTDNGAVQ